MTNSELSKEKWFMEACRKTFKNDGTRLTPTKRQASKYRNKRGLLAKNFKPKFYQKG